MKRNEIRRERKKKNLIRILVISFLAIFAILLGSGGYMYFQAQQATSQSYDDLGREKSELREKKASISTDPISFLLLGIEDYSTGGSNGRSDTIMVLTFNPEDETLKMVSIPRDSLVTIVGKGIEDKINHAYAYGGTEMTINTVENFLNIPIDYYATVNFEGFKNVIDIVGGVTIDVPFDFTEDSDDHTGKLYYYEGEMELNGKEALGYARMRKQDPTGDIGRGERQKQVVKAVISELTSASTVFKIDDLADEYGNNVVSNMKMKELINLYKEYKNFSTSNIEQLNLEGHSSRINNISYYLIDEESLSEVSTDLRNHLDLD